MQIAKIVSSQSHVEYAARVLDTLEVEQSPRPQDYALGRFIVVESEGRRVVGVIANSRLINPEYGNFGPRLSQPAEANRLFSPDYLHEQGVLIGLLMIGLLKDGSGVHETPALVLPVHAGVVTLDDKEMSDFHRDEAGRLRIGYYTQVISYGGALAGALLLAIIDKLTACAKPADEARLKLLKKNIAWQQALAALGQKR